MNRSESEKVAVKNLIWAFWQKGFPILLASLFLIFSCYVPPSGTPISGPEQPPSGLKAPTATAVKPPPAPVYYYPKQGQSPEQQDRDRFECYNWAKKQTGLDPYVSLPSWQWVTIVPAIPPGHNKPVVGGAPGTASEVAIQGRAKPSEGAYSSLDQRGMDFRRAMSACLEGRGYSVR